MRPCQTQIQQMLENLHKSLRVPVPFVPRYFNPAGPASFSFDHNARSLLSCLQSKMYEQTEDRQNKI